MNPGNRLREMRKRAGLTQGELAQRTGVSQPAVSQLENGTRPLQLDWMRAFAREIGCAVADLLEQDDNPDRLSEDERELVTNFRASSAEARSFIKMSTAAVADPALSYQAQSQRSAA